MLSFFGLKCGNKKLTLTNRNKACLAEASFGSFNSRASKGGIKKANIPHAAAHFMRQDVSLHRI